MLRDALPEYNPVIWPKLLLVTLVFGFPKNGVFKKLKAWASRRNFARSVMAVSLASVTFHMPSPGPRMSAMRLDVCCSVNGACATNCVVSNHWSTVWGLLLDVL